jgi:hypothetical protein
MLDPSRLTRLVTLALASCAVTWAFAAGALAMPAPIGLTTASSTDAPAYDPFVADANKAPAQTAPAYKAAPGDTAKTPDPKLVQRVLNGVGRRPVAAVDGGGDDTGTVALVVAIAAMLTALGAVTLIITRTHRPVRA